MLHELNLIASAITIIISHCTLCIGRVYFNDTLSIFFIDIDHIDQNGHIIMMDLNLYDYSKLICC